MGFQPYKLKYVDTVYRDGMSAKEYMYQWTSVVVTTEKGMHVISMQAHTTETELPYETKCAIAEYLGMNFDRPVEEHFIKHPLQPMRCDTHYFTQPIEK